MLPKDIIGRLCLNYRDISSLGCTCTVYYEFVRSTWSLRLQHYYGVIADRPRSLYKKACRTAGQPKLYSNSGTLMHLEDRRDVTSFDHRMFNGTLFMILTTLTGECWIRDDTRKERLPIIGAVDALLCTSRGVLEIAILDDNSQCTRMLVNANLEIITVWKLTNRVRKLLFFTHGYVDIVELYYLDLEGIVQECIDGRYGPVKFYYSGVDNIYTYLLEKEPATKLVQYRIPKNSTYLSAYISCTEYPNLDTITFHPRDVLDIGTLNGALIVLYQDKELVYYQEEVIDRNVIWVRFNYDSSSALAYIRSPI